MPIQGDDDVGHDAAQAGWLRLATLPLGKSTMIG
jgi:hypothetical protein